MEADRYSYYHLSIANFRRNGTLAVWKNNIESWHKKVNKLLKPSTEISWLIFVDFVYTIRKKNYFLILKFKLWLQILYLAARIHSFALLFLCHSVYSGNYNQIPTSNIVIDIIIRHRVTSGIIIVVVLLFSSPYRVRIIYRIRQSK